ncbi:MAG: discoidin domain-containing protein, partial [Phycisphaerae bacterium]|nr:discoidin domain-containing protein [Phycisphaerae bacterium]
AYQITGITNGSLFLSDGVTPITNGQFITPAQGAAGLVFAPTSALTSPGSPFGFSVQASVDGTAGGLGGTTVAASVTVNPTPATGTPSITPAVASEDSQTSSGLVVTASDPNTVSYQINNITNGTLYQNDGVTPITNGQFITAAQGVAGLVFKPTLHRSTDSGSTFSFTAQASSTGDGIGLGGTAATASITINQITTPIYVTSVTSTSANGSYGLNGIVSINVGFSQPVTVTGRPTLSLNSGGTATLANTPTQTWPSNSISFTYAVQPGQNVANLDAASINALLLNGGTITDANGNAVNLTLPPTGDPASLGASAQIAVDTTAPNITLSTPIASSATPTINGTAGIAAGDSSTVTINVFAGSTANGTPTQSFITSRNAQTGAYSATGPSSLLTGSYTVQVAQSDAAGNKGYASANLVVGSAFVQLAGTPSADTTLSWNNSGETYLNVFDNNLNTYFDSPSVSGNWVQLDLGSAQTITGIAYAPRAGYELRMVGGYFQASNDPTFATGAVTIATVNSAPADGLTTVPVSLSAPYRYIRYVAPDNSSGNIAEMQVFGSTAAAVTPPVIISTAHTPTITPATTTTGTQTTSGLVITPNAQDTSATSLAYQITGINNGTLYLNDGVTAINNGAFISAAQGAAGLRFTPVAGLTSTASTFGFSIQASIDGTVAGLGGSVVGATITVNAPATPVTPPTQTVGQLTGASSASTTGSWNNAGNTYAKVFDGNTSTYLDSPVGSGNWVQIDLGSAQTITQIAYAPRVTYESRMTGGIFEASNDSTFATGAVTLYTIAGVPGYGLTTQNVTPGGTYRYVRYVAPANSFGNIAEMQVFGPGGTTTGTGQLTGTSSASTTASWNNAGNTYLKVFDGNTNTYFDSPNASGNWVQLDLGSPQTIGQIVFAPRVGYESRMTGGIFEASNDPTFVTGVATLYTITGTPADGLNTLNVSPGGTYRYVRYVAPTNSYGNIAEMQVFGSSGSSTTGGGTMGTPPTTTTSKLTGTASASTTASWNNAGNTYANVFDGSTSTFFDSPNASGNWVQLDLGAAHTITQIVYAPRIGYESRMIGGIFEVSNDPTFALGVTTLYTITSAPPDGLNTLSLSITGTYRYVRYVAPANSFGNIAEMQVGGV